MGRRVGRSRERRVLAVTGGGCCWVGVTVEAALGVGVGVDMAEERR